MSGRERMIAAVSIGVLVVGVVSALVKSSGTDTTALPPVPSESSTPFETPSETPSELPTIEPTESIEPTSSVEPQASPTDAGEPEPSVGPTSTKQPMPNTGVAASSWGWAFLLLALGVFGIAVRPSRAR